MGTNYPSIAISTDGGSSWQDSTIALYYGYPYSVAIDPQNHDVLYSGGYYNNNGNKGFVYKSADGGKNWTKCYEAPSYNYVYSICIDPSNTNNIYFGSDNGIYKSTDGGQTWNNIRSGTDCFAMYITDAGLIYGGKSNCVERSEDGGTSWETYDDGMDSRANYNCLKIDETNNILYVGTNSSSILKLNLGNSTSIVDNHEQKITSYELYSNYPNPFNSGTTIRFHILKPSYVSMVIYNSAGQKIRTLLNKNMPAGEHYMFWDGKNYAGQRVSSGIYLFRMRAGNFSAVKKMLLLK